MKYSLDLKRIAVFLVFAFGIAWTTALVIYSTGGLSGSAVLVSGTPVTVAVILLPSAYMFAPAVAHVLTRWITGEGWSELYLKPLLRRSWKVWISAWFGPVFLTLAGAAVFYLLFPSFFDSSLGVLRDQSSELERQSGQPLPFGPEIMLAITAVPAILVAPFINSIFTFGEEFGWRGYLQPHLLPLGGRRAMILMGVIWGVWHWPIIAMGYNYGLDYASAPWLGMLAMVWFTFVVGTVLGWLAIVGRSVWPAIIAHASVNATAGLGLIFSSGNPSPLLGPLPIGIVGGIGWTLATLFILSRLPGNKT